MHAQNDNVLTYQPLFCSNWFLLAAYGVHIKCVNK